MFLKGIYEERLEKQARTTGFGENNKPRKHRFQHKNVNVIGSIHNTRGEFEKDENYFARSDIPQRAQEIHKEIDEFIDPDHLELKKARWNSSVYVPKNSKLVKKPFQRKLTKIRMGLHEGHAIQEKKNKWNKYLGTDTRNFAYYGWQCSNDHHTQESRRDRRYKDALKLKRALKNTHQWNQKIKGEYRDPKMRTTMYNEKLRQQKRKDKPIMDTFKNEYLRKYPEAKNYKVDAVVFRQTYSHKLKQAQIQLHNKLGRGKFKPNLKETYKRKKSYKYHHTGKWQTFKFGGQDSKEYYAWSCCMNEFWKSAGCVKVKDGKDGWNLISY